MEVVSMTENLATQMVSTVGGYNINNTSKGIRKNLTTWRRNKKKLYDILSQHPQWNEDALAIISDFKTSREFDYSNFCNLQSGLLCMTNCERDHDKLEHALNHIVYDPDSSVLTENRSAEIWFRENLSVKYLVGQKKSRALGAVCKELGIMSHTNYNALYAKIADCLTPRFTERKLILSIHPCDYLQMSSPQNSWCSCHSLYDGSFCAGTLSYMNDSVSMILYITSVDAKLPYYNEPKINRNVFAFRDGVLLQSRLYPNHKDIALRDTLRHSMQEIFSTCLQIENRWKKHIYTNVMPKLIESTWKPLHYPDYEYSQFNSVISRHISAKKPKIIVGENGYCLMCSSELRESDASLICSTCQTTSKCGKCGAFNFSRVNSYIPILREMYCPDCTDKCEHNNHYFVKNKSTRKHSVQLFDGTKISVCSNCFQNYYKRCSSCHQYYHTEILTTKGKTGKIRYCEECLTKKSNQRTELSYENVQRAA